MGLLDALAGGLEAASGGLAKIGFEQIESDIAEQRQQRMEQLREASQGRLMEKQEGLINDRRKSDFEFDTDPANVSKKADAEAKILTAKGEAETKVLGSPERIKAEKNIALARHIVDPSIALTPSGDGRIMRYDQRSGKSIGYLQDPVTGKDFVGQKDVPASVVAAATSNFTQGAALYKDATTDQEKAAANKLFEEGRNMLAGKQPAGGGKSGWDSATGDVTVDGVVIGKAKSLEEAKQMRGQKQKREPTLDPSGFTPAKGGRINALETRKDPITGETLTKDQWKKKFGEGWE